MDKDMKIDVRVEGSEVVVRTGEAARIYEFKGRDFVANSHKSFVELVKDKTAVAPENAVIAYNDTRIKCIIDDTVREHPFETIEFGYRYSAQFDEWKNILSERGAVFEQKQLVDFIRRQELGVIEDSDVFLVAIKNFRYVLNISGEYTFDDRNNYTFAYKQGETEGTIRIPQYLYVNLELFEESGFVQRLEIEIEFTRPKDDKDKPMFKLSCPKFIRYKNEARDELLKYVKEELKEYLVVAGSI